MTTRSQIPSIYDPIFLRDLAGVENHFGYEDVISEDGTRTIVYPADAYERVQNAITAYPVARLSVDLPIRLADISRLRRFHMQNFVYKKFSVQLDPETRANLSGAALGLTRNENVKRIDWQTESGVFTTMSRDMVLGMADAAFDHVQTCFTRARELSQMAHAAVDMYELAALNINVGWPVGEYE